MNLIVIAFAWGVGAGVLGVIVRLLLKKEVEADYMEIIVNFLGLLILFAIFILAGEQRFLGVDLTNGRQVIVFLIVASIANWFTKAVLVARFIGG